MYAGHLVEAGPDGDRPRRDPKHPYTQLLLSAVADSAEKDSRDLRRHAASRHGSINPGEGCRFRWRCPYAIEKCSVVTPRPRPIGGVQVACHVATGDTGSAEEAVTTSARAR